MLEGTEVRQRHEACGRNFSLNVDSALAMLAYFFDQLLSVLEPAWRGLTVELGHVYLTWCRLKNDCA